MHYEMYLLVIHTYTVVSTDVEVLVPRILRVLFVW